MCRKITSKRLVFLGMVLLMLLSAGLAFTVLRKPKPAAFPKMPAMGMPGLSGFGQGLALYQELEQLEGLGRELRLILAKPRLNDADSVLLKAKLRQIDSIYNRAKAR